MNYWPPKERGASRAPRNYHEKQGKRDQRSASLRDAQYAKPYVVEHQRHDGRWRFYQAYPTQAEAEQVVALLRWAGAVARIDGPAR